MRKLRIGIFGIGRGLHLASDFIRNGCEIAAVCDFHPARLQKAVDQLGPLAASLTFPVVLSRIMPLPKNRWSCSIRRLEFPQTENSGVLSCV